MPTYDPDLAGVLRSLQRQIDQINTSRIGPVFLGPDDGHIRLNDGTTDTGFLDFGGLSIRYQGAMRGMVEIAESFQRQIDANDQKRIDGDEAVRSSMQRQINANDQKRIDGDNGLQGQINANDQKRIDGDAALSTRVTTAQARANDAHADAAAAQSAANSAQSRADSAYSRAGTGISNAATAKARADSAYSLAASRASSGDVSAAVATAKQYTDSRINALVTALRNQGIPIAL